MYTDYSTISIQQVLKIFGSSQMQSDILISDKLPDITVYTVAHTLKKQLCTHLLIRLLMNKLFHGDKSNDLLPYEEQ